VNRQLLTGLRLTSFKIKPIFKIKDKKCVKFSGKTCLSGYKTLILPGKFVRKRYNLVCRISTALNA
jgi:hypothetical protein